MKKHILLFGTIAGLVLAVYIVITFSVLASMDGEDFSGGEIFGYSIMTLVLGFCMILALLRLKKDKIFSIGKGIVVCLGLGTLASLFYVGSWALTYKFIVPDFAIKMIASLDRQLQKGKITLDTYNQYKSYMGHYNEPAYFIGFTLMEILPLAILLAVILPPIFQLFSKKEQGRAQ